MEPDSSESTTTIAPEVLLTIAQLTTLSVPGVSRLSHNPGVGVNRLIKPGHYRDGIKVEVLDDIVSFDIFVVLKNDFNVREVSHHVQHQVSRAITDMVGMTVRSVNIHIEDVDFSPSSESIPT